MKDYVLSKIAISNNGCWLWTGPFNDRRGNKTYGRACYKGWHPRAHVMSFVVFKGEISEGLNVLHLCDNPPCVNPDHLYAGTQKQNCIDFITRSHPSKIKAHYSRVTRSRLDFLSRMTPFQRKRYTNKIEKKVWNTRRERYGKRGQSVNQP